MAEPAPLPRTETSALLDGLRFLLRRPGWTLGLLVLGTLLGQLGPALAQAAHAGNAPLIQAFLTIMASLPMLFIFVPRWIARLDADLRNHPANAEGSWPGAYDHRWFPAALAAALIFFASWLGCALIFPGAVLLALMGFVPTRMLLRGEAFRPALQWNATAVARHWPKLAPAALGILLVFGVSAIGLVLLIAPALPEGGDQLPVTWSLLMHPRLWIAQLLQTLVLLWSFGALLSLYHRLETLSEASPSPQPR